MKTEPLRHTATRDTNSGGGCQAPEPFGSGTASLHVSLPESVWRRSLRVRWPLALARSIFALSCLAALSSAATGVPLDTALERTAEDVAGAAEALARRRASIAEERADLAQRLHNLEEEVGALRTRMATADELEARLRRREESVRLRQAALDGRHGAVSGALGEFRHAAETHMGVVQRFAHRATLDALDGALADDQREPFGVRALAPALTLIEMLARRDPVCRPIAGHALDEAGVRHAGVFVRAGPDAFFIGSNGAPRGLVQADASGNEPMVMALRSGRFDSALPAILEEGRAVLPLDVSGGALQAMLRARQSLPRRLRQGGIVMIPLLAIGCIAFGAAVLRYGSLMRIPSNGGAPLTRLIPHLDAGDLAAARREAEAARPPWREVLTDAVDHWREDRTYLEEILQDRIATTQLELNRYLPALSICAAAAPLLGLLGTVTGMIHTFQLITVFGTGDARTLSGGISEALITTQVGLTIAVPSLLAHAYLARKAKGILAELENAAIRLIRHAKPKAETA